MHTVNIRKLTGMLFSWIGEGEGEGEVSLYQVVLLNGTISQFGIMQYDHTLLQIIKSNKILQVK